MNIIEFIESRLGPQRVELSIDGTPVPIIELNEDYRQLVTTTDEGERYLVAVCYGLCKGFDPLIKKEGYNINEMKEVVSEFFNDEQLAEVAIKVLEISDLDEYLIVNDDEEDEEELEPSHVQPTTY